VDIWFNGNMISIQVSSDSPHYLVQAKELSSVLGYPLVTDIGSPDNYQTDPSYVLLVGEDGLSLFPSNRRLHGPIRVDFMFGSNNHRRRFGGGNGQAIAKAVGVSGRFLPRVLDLTAGLGGDGFVLASLGCRVSLVERHPLICSLLRDGINRAREEGESDPSIRDLMNRLDLIECDSLEILSDITIDQRPDVIYLDPMFPHRKKSAKVKKEMQAFQHIVGSDIDSDGLLERALEIARYRVVIKRPSVAKFLGDKKPTYSLEGKSTRFDIFALSKIPS
jgi:16S rRNA (guanine1516-N2)-methyltransferase